MNTRIILRIPLNSRNMCLGVLEALEPDNYEVPQGVGIKIMCEGNIFVVDMVSQRVHILTVRNTIDDLLVHLNLAVKSISIANKEKEQ